MRRLWLGLILIMVVSWGCLEPSSPDAGKQLTPTSTEAQPVIGGQPDASHPAVGAITVGTGGSFCTGTLVTPQLVVTAAHCVDAVNRYGGPSAVRFRTDTPNGKIHHVVQQAINHPSYSRTSSSMSDNDIAVLILSNKVTGVTPIPVYTGTMDASWKGRMVLVMGYGLIQTKPSVKRATTKYSTMIPIDQVGAKQFIHFDRQTGKSACHGDSGGPALYQINGQWQLVGVTSAGYQVNRNPTGQSATYCDGGTRDCRPDAAYNGFLKQYIQQTGGTTGCTDGQTRSCYSGPAGTQGTGACKAGVETCSGGQWGACTGEVKPAAQEDCNNSLDDNCNGQVNEGCPSCQDGQTRSCYGAAPATQGVGACKAGVETCSGGAWGACVGEVRPAAQEDCNNNLDDNCNGQVNEGCPSCQEGQTRPCYSGAPATNNIGACKSGTETCTGGAWGTCVGEVLPAAQENCGDGVDNDCNGQIDEGCPSVCQEGATDSCYTGPSGTLNIGSCKAGLRTCRQGQWSQCEGEVLPAAQEVCGDNIDNNCNAQVEEGCAATCQPGAKRACYTGTPGTSGIGICQAGSQSCTNGVWGECLGVVAPQQETCGDNIDNNCNGQVDEGCNGTGPNTQPNNGGFPQNTKFAVHGHGCNQLPSQTPSSPWWLACLCLLFFKRRTRQ